METMGRANNWKHPQQKRGIKVVGKAKEGPPEPQE